MDVESIIRNIIAIPLDKVLINEGTIKKIAKRIAQAISNDGMQYNPIIVTEKDSYYIVLDGNHRVRAMEELNSPAILAYLINYNDYVSEIDTVQSWDALISQPFSAKEFINTCFDRKSIKINKTSKPEKARANVMKRRCYFAIHVKGDKSYMVSKKGEGKELLLDDAIEMLRKCEQALDDSDINRSYVCDDRSDARFQSSESNHALIIRPKFTPEEIVKVTLGNKLFPKKSTRHIINNRPLYANIHLKILLGHSNIEEKNKKIQEILQQRLRDHRVRVYEESICILNE